MNKPAASTYNNAASAAHPVIAGALTSQVAGLIMAVVVMTVFTLFLGKGPLYPVQVIGSIAFGEQALVGFHADAFLIGLIAHQFVALCWGIVFTILAIMLKVRTVRTALVLGLSVAAASMIDSYVLVPAAMVSLNGVDIWNREVPMFWNWAAHVVYGLSFALYPKILEKTGA